MRSIVTVLCEIRDIMREEAKGAARMEEATRQMTERLMRHLDEHEKKDVKEEPTITVQ